MDFAPYQDTAPEHERALSPPPPLQNRLSDSRSRSPLPQSPPLNRSSIDSFPVTSALPAPGHFGGSHGRDNFENRGVRAGGDIEGGRPNVDLFETSLPIRLDYEAMLAYLLLPPAGGVLLLVLEHKSDYVRFHAWQSSLLFAAIFLLHLILTFSAVLSWMLFIADIAFIGFLALHAYRDADALDRFEVPFFGGLASSFVDNE